MESSITSRKNKKRSTQLNKIGLYSKSLKNEIKVEESDSGFHYELKIPGYIKEDFNFYISGNHLVLTTDKSKCMLPDEVNRSKHSYCYPSAYFKRIIPLPNKPIEKRITVNYENETLYFILYKL
ncbi:Hsp20/alpha crystallin family protein [Seonamhaeicola aphaedonensis]|uniref:SHSP domain-containing protein n=1 Tax=Seonamhaeicola aphaedonensis TaxID=1461338 RepID=A0A3D9H5Y5_9FLAO|nr:hypothetical protein [Seonamhaeicola aphaedonensis]RED44915.1 hypothetical protein DFQ02_10932 [Seonamhaeicola aphaedonensis]